MNEKKELKISILIDKKTVSTTLNDLVDNFIGNFKNKLNKNFKVKTNYLLENENIRFCINCKQCFKENICSLDQYDEMRNIKRKLVDSDLFIIACPVYEKNVSAYIKLFLDRIGYWCHLMPMLGKKCVIIVSGKNSGNHFVCKYLYEILTYLGFDVCCVLNKTLSKSNEDIFNELNEDCTNIADAFNKNRNNCSNENLEKIFQKYKLIFQNAISTESNNFEIAYWKEMRDFDTYQSFIEHTMNTNYNDCIFKKNFNLFLSKK